MLLFLLQDKVPASDVLIHATVPRHLGALSWIGKNRIFFCRGSTYARSEDAELCTKDE